MPNDVPGAARPAPGAPADRTYVVVRYARAPFTPTAPDELTPLGTVPAPARAAARARARAVWPDEVPTGLRVRRASACHPTVLLGALAADGVRLLGHGR